MVIFPPYIFSSSSLTEPRTPLPMEIIQATHVRGTFRRILRAAVRRCSMRSATNQSLEAGISHKMSTTQLVWSALNDDAQHGKDGACFITLDIHYGDFYVFPYLCHFIFHVKGVTTQYSYWGATGKARKGNFSANLEGGSTALQYESHRGN